VFYGVSVLQPDTGEPLKTFDIECGECRMRVQLSNKGGNPVERGIKPLIHLSQRCHALLADGVKSSHPWHDASLPKSVYQVQERTSHLDGRLSR
jgi:hypothetical protein